MDVTGWTHLCIYVGTFASSYYYSLMTESLMSALCLGWSIYGLTTIGHDLLHKPTTMNRCVAFVCMDMIILDSDSWIQQHNKDHHGDLKGDKDFMYIKGSTIFEEWYNLLDICKTSSPKCHMLRAPFYLLLLQLRWYQIIETYITIFFCLAYFTYITHSDSIPSKYPRGCLLHNLDNTWDIFPESRFITLLFGGLNVHATHHCFPTCGRSKLAEKSRYLATTYPDHYRSITTCKQLYHLYSHRRPINNK